MTVRAIASSGKTALAGAHREPSSMAWVRALTIGGVVAALFALCAAQTEVDLFTEDANDSNEFSPLSPYSSLPPLPSYFNISDVLSALRSADDCSSGPPRHWTDLVGFVMACVILGLVGLCLVTILLGYAWGTCKKAYRGVVRRV